MKKKLILFSVFLCIVFGLILVIIQNLTNTGVTAETIEEAIHQYTDNPFLVEHIIEKVTIDEDIVLVFMLNENKTAVYYSILEKQWDGKWEVKNLSWIPTMKHPGETNPYSYANIKSENINGYWGVLFDSNIETIVMKSDKEEFANVIDSPNSNPIWYKIYKKTNEEMININIVKAIDSNGIEVPWSPFD